MQDLFKEKAGDWDKGNIQKTTPQAIANAIEKKINLNENMTILDFGVGTGLLGFLIATKVKKVYGVDMSPSMLQKLEEKNSPDLNIEAVCQDIVKEPLTNSFDGIVSSMTLHHVENLENFFTSIYKNINRGGFLAIADLEKEDGSFHSDNTGVFHFGFTEKGLCEVVKKCGFLDVTFENITTIQKPQQNFGIFLMTATKH